MTTRQDIVNEARTWIGTPWGHQQVLKGVQVDCDNFVAGVARNAGAKLAVEWVNNYRRVESGAQMLELLEANLQFISGRIEDALPGDVLTLCDELLRRPEKPRHLAFLTEWKREDVPYAIHASERGVVEHRFSFLFKRRVHSVWRERSIYEQDLNEGYVPPCPPEVAARKIQEFRDALLVGEVNDPITGTIFTMATLKAVAISLAVSAASMLLTRALAPKPKPTEKGRLSGELVIQNSEQGVMIPEVYGAPPADEKGGVLLPAHIIWTSGVRKHTSVTRQEVGGGKGFGGQTQEVTNITYDFDIALMWGRGALRVRQERANMDVIYDTNVGVGSYEGESSGNTFGAPYQITANDDASGGSEVTLQPGGSVQFNAVFSNGAATRNLVAYYLNSDPTPMELYVNGVLVQSVTLSDANNVYRSRMFSVSLNDGNNTIKIKNTSVGLNLRIDRIFCFGGQADVAASTGVVDPAGSPDSTYDPAEPPDPSVDYASPVARLRGDLVTDSYGAGSGTLNHGGNSGVTHYPGNTIQLQDPTIEAAVDAALGAGSTPAYRNRAYTVHTNFSLTRWGGALPNFQAWLEHETIRYLSQMCGHFCDRVNALTTDYNFTAFAVVPVRGVFIAGRRYQPSEVMESAEPVYNCYFSEPDGVITGSLQGGASVDTVYDYELGWTEGEDIPDGVLPEIDTTIENETKLSRRIDVKFRDPDNELDPNTQGEIRQITLGQQSDVLDVQFTLTAEEARTIATRELYRQYVGATRRKFNASWEKLWWNAGDTITIIRAEGFTLTVQLLSIRGGVGVLECEAVDVEQATFTQPSIGDGGIGFETPPVQIPSMSVLALLDIPIRDKDETLNNGAVQYGAMTPRTNSGQAWAGGSLYVNKVGWERIGDFTLPATIGVISDFDITTTDTSVFDPDGWIEFDLYHSDNFTPTLESIDKDTLGNANALAVNTSQGELIIQFADAEQVSANRWRVSTLLYGRGGTEHLLPFIEENRRVVLLNEAVQPIPMNLSDLNRTLEYKAVTFGQSLDDAATVQAVWTGKSLQPLSVINIKGARDSADSRLIRADFRTRVGGGLRSNQAGAINEETLEGRVQVLNDGSPTLPNGKERVLDLIPGMQLAAFLRSDKGTYLGCDQNNFSFDSYLTYPNGLMARTQQEIPQTENFLEAGLRVENLSLGFAAVGLQRSGQEWRSVHLTISSNRDAATLPSSISFPYLVILTDGGFPGQVQELNVYEYGEKVFSASSDSGEPDYDPDFGWHSLANGDAFFRVRFQFVGSSVRIMKTHAVAVPFTTIYTGRRAVEFPLFGLCTAAVGAYVLDVKLTTYPQPQTIYSHKQIREDFLLDEADPLPELIEYEIWQHSKLVGAGVKTRIEL